MEFSITQRGARSLVYQGYKYVINRRGRDGKILWRCAKSRSCSGGMTTMDNEIISPRDTHNHPSDAAELEAEKITMTIKCKAMESAQPIQTLYLHYSYALFLPLFITYPGRESE